MYEKDFRRDFHLRFKPPRKDTCQMCGMLNIQIKAAESEYYQEICHSLKIKQEIHQCKVQLARQSGTVFSFDMQKVMLLAKLTYHVTILVFMIFQQSLVQCMFGTKVFYHEEHKKLDLIAVEMSSREEKVLKMLKQT
ncbi:hypothetical protein PR048_032005, partial [Dryococelus australis]